MRQNLLRTIFSLAVLLSASTDAQTPVDISFQADPVQVQTGAGIQFTVITVSSVFTMTWQYQGGVTLGLWVVDKGPSVQPVPQFQGRVTITATTLQITNAALTDAGLYTVEVVPAVSTGLGQNSKSVTLQVYDAVTGVNLFVPQVAIEGKNITLTCTYQTGTEVNFLWIKDGTTLASGSRITISGGSLIINPGERSDAGDYTCTVGNPVSSRSAKQTLTVYYGPDTPVLTKDTVKDCVGEGDVWAGKTITLTCTSTSLPQAQFSWQFDGQAITSPDTGQLILQTSSTSQSGRYTCTARNSITKLTSEQSTDLVVTNVCLDVGEVVGVVIGSFILLILLIILIILLIRFILVRRRRREASNVQKTDANPRPIPENPPANVGRDLAQGPQPHPPLYHGNHLYAPPVNGRNEDVQRQSRNTQNIPASSRHNGTLLANGRQHNAIQNSINRTPHGGFENQAFTLNELQTAPQQPTHNPDIVIQTGNAQVRLNTLQQAAQQSNNGQIPTIHVNLNSYSGDQQTPMETSGPPIASTTVDEATQTPQNARRAASTLRSPMLDQHRAILQADPGQIPTGYTHYNRNNIVERNANIEAEMYNRHSEPRGRSDSRSTQPASRRQGESYNNRNNIERNSSIDMEMYNQQSEPRGRADSRSSQPASQRQGDNHNNRNNIVERNSNIGMEVYNQRSEPRGRADSRSSQPASQQQQPWDTLRGTPSYPNNQRRMNSDSSDYTTHPPLPQARSRSRERNERPRERENRRPSREREAESRARSERRSSPREETRGRRESRGPRQEGSRDNSPRALPLMSQPTPAGRLQNQPDTRALVDPNHLPQSQASQQFRQVPHTSNRTPQVNQEANQMLQNVRSTNQIPQSNLQVNQIPQSHLLANQMPQSNLLANQMPQSNRTANHVPQTRQPARPQSQLTQEALQAHTEKAKAFQNRRQQTQAALLHPGPQGTRPPTPPPVIPLQQFQALPKERTRQREVRPPVNMPVAQRPHQGHHGHHKQHVATMPQSHHHHHHHQSHHHPGHRPTQAQTWQQQAHRGMPR